MMDGEHTNGFREVLFALNRHLRNICEWHRVHPFGVFIIYGRVWIHQSQSVFLRRVRIAFMQPRHVY